jgi:hypothetical protein
LPHGNFHGDQDSTGVVFAGFAMFQ